MPLCKIVQIDKTNLDLFWVKLIISVIGIYKRHFLRNWEIFNNSEVYVLNIAN